MLMISNISLDSPFLARSFGFEQIARVLERQLHQAVLEVNLDAFADNLRIYRSYLKAETKLMIHVVLCYNTTTDGGDYEVGKR